MSDKGRVYIKTANSKNFFLTLGTRKQLRQPQVYLHLYNTTKSEFTK